MGRAVTRSRSTVGTDSQPIDVDTSQSLSEKSLSRTRKGRVSKKRKKSMSKRDSAGPELNDSVQSLSLDDSHCSQEACSSKINTTVPSSPTEIDETTVEPSSKSKPPKPEKPECSICIQPALQPVKLPCNHIFCFLCIKGAVHNGTNSCALCRAPLPRNYIFNPDVMSETSGSSEENSVEDQEAADKWYYEGRNGGWWEFDPRTAEQIEDRYNQPVDDNPRTLELLIAGFVYVIDLDNMCQRRKNNPQVMRRIKRDKEITDKRGVAGIVKSDRRRNRPRRNLV